jgi:predicted RNA-binding protein with EMAP domain
MKDLEAAAGELSNALEPFLTAEEAPPMLKANVAWCMRTLSGLRSRLEGPAESMAAGADLVVVEVRIVSKLGKRELWRTRVTDGKSDYTVVTNIPGVRVGDAMAVAFLPPREVGGEISEAMFLGAEKRAEPVGTHLTAYQVDPRDAAAILHEEL